MYKSKVWSETHLLRGLPASFSGFLKILRSRTRCCRRLPKKWCRPPPVSQAVVLHISCLHKLHKLDCLFLIGQQKFKAESKGCTCERCQLNSAACTRGALLHKLDCLFSDWAKNVHF